MWLIEDVAVDPSRNDGVEDWPAFVARLVRIDPTTARPIGHAITVGTMPRRAVITDGAVWVPSRLAGGVLRVSLDAPFHQGN